jgi:hypothetical protein
MLSILAQVDVVDAAPIIWELCCTLTALCMDIPKVSAMTVLIMDMDCEAPCPTAFVLTWVIESVI